MATLSYVRCLINVKFPIKKRTKDEEDGENEVKKSKDGKRKGGDEERKEIPTANVKQES